MTLQPEITTTTLSGRTRRVSSEYIKAYHQGWRHVLTKDPSGKPAIRTDRYVVITVGCADGVQYTWEHDVLMLAGGGCLPDSPCATVVVHGMFLRVTWSDLPPNVRAAHRVAIVRTRACAWAVRDQLLALPRFKPTKKAKAKTR